MMACSTITAAFTAQTPRLSSNSLHRRNAHPSRPRILASASPQQNSSSDSSNSPSISLNPVQDFKKRCEAVLHRYDFVSAGLGALLVTGICVSHGQDPGTALWITAASTVVALVVNDVMDS